MKIFLSWSGDRSKAVASIFADWIRCVLQAADPWISTRDIDRGAVWFSEIGDQLNGVSMGIVFLTRENKDRPWILFESGALYKGLDTRVCTLLIDLGPADVQAPLGQFNHTLPTAQSMRDLVYTLNSRIAIPLDEKILDQVFQTYWPQFHAKFEEALAFTAEAAPPAEVRSEQNLLAEILENTRSLSKRISALDHRLPPLEHGSRAFLLPKPKSRGDLPVNKLMQMVSDTAWPRPETSTAGLIDMPGDDKAP